MIRPIVSQIVIDEFTKIIDSQDTKGLEKYGTTIDQAANAHYNWELMALEETADLQKYLVKRIMQLSSELTKAKERIKELEEKTATVFEDENQLNYKKKLAEFMQQINPKPTIEQIEKIKQNYIKNREKGGTGNERLSK
jgi:predicted nuclease with TOPRIM domain